MENSPAHAHPPVPPAATQRRIALHRAAIRTDESRLERTAAFTDGSTGAVEMKWNEVRRVAAFRRDVMTEPVLCVAISDPANIVVLDESMDGWQSSLNAMSQHLAESPSFTDWQAQIPANSGESHWTVLFRAGN
jgi:hypothetical protein